MISPLLRRRTLFPLLALVLVAGACAPVIRPTGTGMASPDAAWNQFWAVQDRPGQAASLSLTASLDYSSPARKNRVILSLFGNYDYPLRLDLSAGFGNPIGFWREDDHGWLAYYPGEQTAYSHLNGRLGSAALGFETPLTLRELALLLSGRYGALVPKQYSGAKDVKNGFEFTFPDTSPVRSLVLDPWGRPLSLVGFETANMAPWRIELQDFARPGGSGDQSASGEDQPPTPEEYLASSPKTLILTRAPEESVTVRIKRFETSGQPRPAETLRLALPPGTRMVRLDNRSGFGGTIPLSPRPPHAGATTPEP